MTEGGGAKIGKEMCAGCTRPEGVSRGRRITTQSEIARQFQATTRSARAKWVRAKVNTYPPALEFWRRVRDLNP